MVADRETLIAKYTKYIKEDKTNVEDALSDFADEVIGLTVRALVAEEEE